MCRYCFLKWPSGVRALIAVAQASTCGDCLVPRCKTSVCQSALSVKGAKLWNSLPTKLKQEID